MTNTLEWLLGALLVLLGTLGTLGTSSQITLPPSVDTPPSVGSVTNPAPPMPDSTDRDAAADAESALLDFLALVPWSEANRDLTVFGDVQAWHEATGIARLHTFDQLQNLSDAQREAWMFGLVGDTMPPAALGIQYLAIESMRARYGFSFFDALQTAEAGSPPDALTITRVDASPTLLHQALLARGYTVEEKPEGTLYSLRDDYEIDLTGDVFSRLALLNRIFVLNREEDAATTLLIGRATSVINNALAAQAGITNTLLDDPFVAAVAQEIEAFAAPGLMTGAIFVGGPMPGDPMAALGQSGEALQDALRRYGEAPLDLWMQSAFTTHRAGDDLYMTAFLVFPPGVDAQLNAERLAARMAEYPVITGRLSAEEAWTVHALGAGGSTDASVAWVTMQVNEARVNREYWMNAVARRDQLYLTPGVPLVAD